MKLGLIFVGLMVLAVGLALQPLLAKGGKGKNAKTLAFLGILIVVASGGVYYLVGSPAMVNSPTFLEGFNTGGGRASLTGQEPVFPSLEEIIDKQKAVVAQNPEDVGGWTRLARTLTGLERYGEAIAAYRRAIALTPENAGLFLALGEALTFRDQGLISDEALKAFETAVKLNPGELFAKLYLGDYSFQTGDVQLALVRWLALYEEAAVDTAWLPLLEQRILRAATALGQDDPQILAEKRFQEPATPSAEEIQQMTPEDQAAIIENMVATLEARMEENPGDLAGWERLGRSYMVLERYQDGLYAFGLVAGARPDDPVVLENYIQALLAYLEQTGQHLNDQAVAALLRLITLDPENSTALFFLGQAAAERADPASARLYWQRLLTLINPTSDGADIVREKLGSLS